MGLLDDAIREHLELKRQHGADPDEVARQEQEVLGETARKAEFAKLERDGDVAAAEEPAEAGDEREPFDAEALEAGPAAAAEPETAAEPEPEAVEPPPEPEASEAGYDEDPWLADERDEVPADEALDRPPRSEEAEPGEDVLEETPDFLQETPEHDRLWFEQRPPRDFDWDK
jgi:hypothetical protein